MKSRHHKLSSSSRASSKIKVSCLTSKVTRDHLMEIFSSFGNIVSIEMVSADKPLHDTSLQSACITYDTKSEAGEAVKSMDGGMIDLHEILVESVSRKAQENHKSRKPKK